MPKNIYRGDAPTQAQVSKIPAPPANTPVTIKINGKSLGTWEPWDAQSVIDAWNATEIPEFQEVDVTLSGSDVLLTSKVPGQPFSFVVTYGGDTITNEKQLITIANAPTGGTFKLLYLAEATANIAFNASAATILSALEGLSHFVSGDLAVVASGSNGFIVTFQGRYTGVDAETLAVDFSLLRGGSADVTVTTVREFTAAQNKKVKVEIGGGPTGGYHQLTVDGTIVKPIDWNDNLAGIQAEFNTDLGAGKATISNVSSANPTYDPIQELFDNPTDTKSGYIDNPGGFTQSNAAGIIRIGGPSVLSFGVTTDAFIHFEGANLSIPATATIESVSLELESAGSTGVASATTTIRAVDQATPAKITSKVDFAGRPRTTASINEGLPYQDSGATYTINGLEKIIQELVTSYGSISSLILLLEDTAIDSVTNREYKIGTVKLSISYRTGNAGSGLVSYEVEFIGTLGNKDVDVVASHSLTPARANDTWEFDLEQTQAYWGETGNVKLWNDATGTPVLIDEAGSIDPLKPEDMVTFQNGVTAIMGRLVGDNYTLVQSSNNYTWTVELIDLEAGLNGNYDTYRMTWQPIDKSSNEPTDDPIATLEKIQDGGGAVGEIKKITFDGTAVRGTYKISSSSGTTVSLQFDADAATVQAAMETVYGAGKVTVTGTAGVSLDVTFDVSLGDIGDLFFVNNMSSVIAEITSSTIIGSDPITSTINIGITGVAGTGSFFLSLNGLVVMVAYNATASGIKDSITSLLAWADSVSVTWSASGGTITVVGAYGVSAVVSTSTLDATTSPLISGETVYNYTAAGNTIYEITIPTDAYDGYVVLINGTKNASAFWGGSFETNLLSALPFIFTGSASADFLLTQSNHVYRIEFKGSLTGVDYTMTLESYLRGYRNNYQLVNWAKIIDGINGASMILTVLQAGHADLGERQMIRVPSDVWYGSYTLTRGANTTAALQFDGNDATVQSAIEALASVGAGKVICSGPPTGILCEFDTSLGNIATMVVVETDITNSNVVISTSLQGGIVALNTVTESRGPEHWDDPLNWTLGHIPEFGEDVIFETGEFGPKYGLRQAAQFTADSANDRLLASVDFRVGQVVKVVNYSGALPAGLTDGTAYYIIEVNRDAGWVKVSASSGGSPVNITDAGTGTHYVAPLFNSLIFHNRAGGPVGLPRRSENNYYEYRQRHLLLAMNPAGDKLIEIGRGEGSGSSLLRLNFLFGKVDLNVFSTGSSAESGAPTLDVITSGTDTVDLSFFDGDSGIAYFEGDAATVNKIVKRGGDVRGGEITMATNGTIIHDGDFPNIRKLFADATGVSIIQEA